MTFRPYLAILLVVTLQGVGLAQEEDEDFDENPASCTDLVKIRDRSAQVRSISLNPGMVQSDEGSRRISATSDEAVTLGRVRCEWDGDAQFAKTIGGVSSNWSFPGSTVSDVAESSGGRTVSFTVPATLGLGTVKRRLSWEARTVGDVTLSGGAVENTAQWLVADVELDVPGVSDANEDSTGGYVSHFTSGNSTLSLPIDLDNISDITDGLLVAEVENTEGEIEIVGPTSWDLDDDTLPGSITVRAKPTADGDVGVAYVRLRFTKNGGTIEDRVKVTVLKVLIDVNGVFSAQFPGRHCNPMANPPPANSDIASLYMGAAAGGYCQMEVMASVQKPENAGDSLIGLLKDGTVYGSTTINATGPTQIGFELTGLASYLYLVGGIDMDRDGVLDIGTEITTNLPSHRIHVITADSYAANLLLIDGGSHFPGLSGVLLETFVDGTAPAGASVGTASLTSGDPSLTHPMGAVWGENCTAEVPFYEFPNGSSASDEIEAQSWFDNEIYDFLSDPIRKQEVQEYFQVHPSEPAHTFSWHLNFGSQFSKINDAHLFLAFGHVTIGVNVAATVLSDLSVANIQIVGGFEPSDIYDFDINADFPAPSAAAVQMGYSSLGAAGRVFRTNVIINRIDYPLFFSFE